MAEHIIGHEDSSQSKKLVGDDQVEEFLKPHESAADLNGNT